MKARHMATAPLTVVQQMADDPASAAYLTEYSSFGLGPSRRTSTTMANCLEVSLDITLRHRVRRRTDRLTTRSSVTIISDRF